MLKLYVTSTTNSTMYSLPLWHDLRKLCAKLSPFSCKLLFANYFASINEKGTEFYPKSPNLQIQTDS